MKKFLLLFAVAMTFIGCSLSDDDNPKFHLELLPVESAVLPAEFKKDSVYELPIKYIRPTTCHIFEGFYYERNENVRTVAIQSSVVEQDNCVPASTEPITEKLKFKPTIDGSYIFKFWKGQDANGEDVFEEIEVPVVP